MRGVEREQRGVEYAKQPFLNTLNVFLRLVAGLSRSTEVVGIAMGEEERAKRHPGSCFGAALTFTLLRGRLGDGLQARDRSRPG